MGRIFWIVGLSSGVLVFAALSVVAIIFAIKERNLRLMIPALGCAGFAWRAFDVLQLRIKGPKVHVPRLDIEF
jgi:hypothetical protein